MHVGLCILTLGNECGFEGFPLLLGCWVVCQVHGNIDGETLTQEQLCNSVFAIPAFALQLLCVCGLVGVIGNGAHLSAIEEIPVASEIHCSLEAE